MTIAVILGAGFSKCAGLPTQAEFFDLLLAGDSSPNPLQKCITEVMQQFLRDVFGWRPSEPLPSLEDYFTCIDLSANTGHHLGIRYTPKMLRAIRRMTVHRILQVLDLKYQPVPSIARLLRWALTQEVGFTVLNWDVVLERALQEQGRESIDYGFECYDWQNPSQHPPVKEGIAVAKINGSSNWAYCDNCSTMFYDRSKLALSEMVGLVKADFRLFDATLKGRAFDEALGLTPQKRECPFCKNMVSTHIATFSFRKSYRTYAYPAIWHAARHWLSRSSRWLFVGYSLPDADYEFKHLLKTAQLALDRRKDVPPLAIDVVLKNNPHAERRYRGLFGSRIQNVCQGGLEEYVGTLA